MVLPIPTTYDRSKYGHALVLLFRNSFVQDEPSETGEKVEAKWLV